MRLGVSYYPELVDEQEWAHDLDTMRRGGLSVVRMLEFAWSAVEPREGEYQFGWLDRFLALAQERGMEVILGTPTASPPAWLLQQYPAMLVELRDGSRLAYGGRRICCVNNHIYRQFSEQIARVLGARYGRHPAVIGWQIDNELIGPEIDRFECHCPDCHWRFRHWLKQRYASVQELNRAWGLGFWSLAFSDWGEVPTPRAPGACSGHVLDFFRFYNDSIVEYLRLQYDALRATIAPHQFVSHNSTGVFDRGINHRDFARVLDETGWDAYRGAAANVHPAKEPFTGLAHDMFRAARHQPFWVFETNVVERARPDHLRQQTPAYLAEMRARGAKGIIFWHWRRHQANQEQSCLAFTDYGGRVQEDQLQFVRDIKARLDQDGELPARLPAREAAILFSADEVRAVHRRRERPIPYLHALVSLYEPFWRAGVGMDVVNPGDDLTGYRLLALPSWRHVSAADAEKVRAFVHAGGVLLATAKTAHKNLHGSFHPTLGGPLADVIGCTFADDEDQKLSPRIRLDDGREFPSEPYYECVTTAAATVLGRFVDGDVAGLPAVLRNDCGKGTVFYVAGLNAALYAVVAQWAAAKAGLRWWDNPHPDVTVIPHLTRAGEWWLINHGATARRLGAVEIPARDFQIVKA